MKSNALRSSVIYCLSPLTRGLLNFVVLTMPLWLFLAPYFAYTSLSSYWSSQFFISPSIAATGFLLFSIFVLFCSAISRVVIRRGQFFGPGDWNGLPLSFLRRVFVDSDHDPRYLVFSFDANGCERQKKIRLANVSDDALEALLDQIERNCPSARVSLKIRDYAINRASCAAGNLRAEFAIPYHCNIALRRLNEMLTLRRKSMVRAWCWFWTASGIVMLPLTITMFCALTHSIHQSARADGAPPLLDWLMPTEHFIRTYGKEMESCLNFVIGRPIGYVSEGTHNGSLVLAVALTFGGLILSLCLVAMLPNALHVSDQALTVFTRRGRARFGKRKVEWKDLVSVVLHRPQNSASTDKWQIYLCCGDTSKPALKLNFAAFPGGTEQKAFIQAIEKYAPHAAIDSALLEYFAAPATKSYTELWLQSLSSPPKRERLTPLQPGHRLQSSKYTVTSKLAVGGQATAYLAEDQASDSVVLKEFVLPVYVDNEVRKQVLEKFQRESQMLKDLDHPRIVKLQNYFIEDHRAYLVLEHVKGRSLRRLVESDGAVSASFALKLVDQMCDILEYLHGLAPPLVHRDFTPDNLILGDNGELKLIDFDVARRTDTQAKTSVVGKHAFIPPEQFRGKPTCQSDVYALGATLYYVLTGQDPEPLTRSTLPREFQEEQAGALREIIERATELDQSARYQSASALRASLPGVKVQVSETVQELL